MDHAEAVQTRAVEKYLLGEFSPAEEDEFADHFFGCRECASDLKITSLFIDTTKKVLGTGLVSEARSTNRRWRMEWLPSQYAVAASIVFLAIILYQNVIMIPKLRRPSAPQALAFFSLGTMGTRGVGQTIIVPPQGKPFILLIDIPSHEDLSGYRCEILTQNGDRVLSVDVSDVLAQKSVPILIPASVLRHGDYVFTISGRPKDGHASYTEIDRYQFQVM
jgi:hypothetical protein